MLRKLICAASRSAEPSSLRGNATLSEHRLRRASTPATPSANPLGAQPLKRNYCATLFSLNQKKRNPFLRSRTVRALEKTIEHPSSMRRHSQSISFSDERPQIADQVRDSRTAWDLVSQPYLRLACLFLFPSRRARGVKLFRCLFSAVVCDLLPSTFCMNPSCILAPPATCGRFLRQQKSSVPPQGRSPQFFCVTPRPLLADRRHRPRG
jgi:hypothetical protein